MGQGLEHENILPELTAKIQEEVKITESANILFILFAFFQFFIKVFDWVVKN